MKGDQQRVINGAEILKPKVIGIINKLNLKDFKDYL